MIMKSLLLYFLMFYLLQVSFAEITVCKRITSNKESENVSKHYHKSFIFIEKTNSIKGPKGENGTKGEKGENGVKGQKGENGTKGERGENGVKGQKGENRTKGERGDKGEKGKIVHINQTEINHLKHKIKGWIVLASKLSCV